MAELRCKFKRRKIPIPQVTASQIDTDRQYRIDAASKSILDFGRIYFAHYLYRESSPLHEYLVDRLYRAITSQHNTRSAIAAPRGNAKTTWISKITPLWCICFPEIADKHFILLLSDTTGQSKDNLISVRHELESNSLLRGDFGDLVGKQKWTEEKILTANGIRVEAYGATKSLRGATSDEDRPDLIIADDLENEELVATPFQRDKLNKWWTDTALKTAGPKGVDAFAVGTVLHPDSVLRRLLDNSSYGAKMFRAVEQWPERHDLWQHWERLYTDLSIEDELERKDRALAYYEANRAEMDRGAEVLWQEGDPLYNLRESYVTDGPASFNREKQNEPRNEEDCIFQEVWFRYWWHPEEEGRPQDLRLPEIKYTIGALDPSLGKRKKRGDYSAIIVLGRGVDGRDYVIEADLQRRPPDKIISDVIAFQKRYHCREWAVDSIAFQDFIRTELEKRALEEGVHVPTVPIHVSTDKGGRIESLQPAVRSGFIVFHATQALLLSQMQFFTGHKGDHDDGPDALEMAYSLGQQGLAAMAVAPTPGSYRPSDTIIERRGVGGALATSPRRGGIFDRRR